MKSLLKIHTKYFFRNKFMLIWTYLLIPIIAFIFSIINLCINRRIIVQYKKQNKTEALNIQEDYLFNGKYYYYWIYWYFYDSIILVNNETDYDFLPKFILNQTGIYVSCFMNKKDINQTYSFLIEIINEYGKYRFKFIRKTVNSPLSFYPEDFRKSIDIFYIKDPSNSYYIDYYNYDNYQRFLEFQSLFSKYLIYKEKQMEPSIDLKINLGFNTYPTYTDFDDYNKDEIPAMCFSTFISFLLSMYAYFFNLEMINEKEKKLDNYLERKGISSILFLFSWFLIYLMVLTIPIIVILIFAYTNIIAFGFCLMFLLNIILYILDLFSVLLFFYILIPNKKYGFIIIKFYNFISPILGLGISFISNSKTANVIFSFIPQINFIICTKAIFKLQKFPYPSWEKIWLKANKMSYMECIIMYIPDFILYFGLFIFFFSYQQSNLDFFSFLQSLFKKNQSEEEIKEDNNNNHLIIDKLSKSYEKINAINNFNLDLYSNEIFCLLGENGSGKSTLLNIISGNLKPDIGDIIYKGKSLIKSKSYNNQNISYYLQDNYCFDYLTVKEHLEYISEIINKNVNQKKIQNLIKKMKLNDQKDCLYYYLSEGEKRKLIIALFLLDDSNIILLDDPTNSIDNISKPEIWNLIKENKKDKIILITTHSIYEAKYLGDKIGIINNGNLVCCGTDSNLSLKNATENSNDIYIYIFRKSNSTPTGYKNEDILTKIKENIQIESGLEIEEINSKLFSIIIKSDFIKKDKDLEITKQDIYKILDYIKVNLQEFGIEDYTISSVSLENYFEKIIKKDKDKALEEEIIEEKEEKIGKKENIANFGKQINLQLKRIFLIMFRNIMIYFIELLSILICTYFFIFILANIIMNNYKMKLNLLNILEENPIYIYENKTNYLKNSYVYDLSKSIKFKRIKERPATIEHFIGLAEKNSLANIAKGSISINRQKTENGENFVEAYNTYIYNNLHGYLFANTFLIVSSFLKNEYNIDASIFTELEDEEGKNNNNKEETNLKISIFIYFFELLIFFAGLIYERVKERKGYIKNFLHLNGINKWSYWISFFIIDFARLIIISLILVLPMYYINIIYTNYILANIFITNISLIIFIYFISSFFYKEDSGTKFLFLLSLLSIIIAIFLVIIANETNYDDFNNYLYEVFERTFNFTIFDITPISSMIFSFLRILSFNYWKIKYYLVTSYITQLVNIIFYGGLLILLESGFFNRLFQHLKSKKIKEELNKSHMRDNSEEFNFTNNEKEENSSEIIYSYQPKIIEIKGIFKIFNFCYGRINKIININEDIILTVNEKLGMLGNNGSGRTTIFKSIINEISYEKGSINLFGNDNKKDFNKIKSKIGYCPQMNVEFDSMKVKEIIQFFLDLKSQEITSEFLCHKFCLQNYLETYYNNLSFGNKRKLFLLISLINYPELLLLDDPFNSIDDISKKIIIRNLNKLFTDNNYNCNILMSSNSFEEINELCNINIFLNSEGSDDFNPDSKEKDKYKLLIKLNDSLINSIEEISNQTIQETLERISKNVEGFDEYKNYFMNNSRLEPILNKLADIINKIIESINYIKLRKIEKNLLFEFDIIIVYKEILYTLLGSIINEESNLISELKVLKI